MFLTLSRGPAKLLTLAMVVLISFSAASCGNGDGADPTSASATPGQSDQAPPTTPGLSPTPSLDAATLALLEQAVFAEDDVPEGLVALSSEVSTNEDVASAAADADAQLALFAEWQRLLGLEVVFLPSPSAPADIPVRSVTSAASAYGIPDGASQSYQADVEKAVGLDWQLQYSNLTDVQVETLDASSLGSDEGLWLRITGLQEGSTSIDDYVLMRTGVLRLFVHVVSVGAEVDGRSDNLEIVRELAQTQAGRGLAALEGS
jgi:hypothetical protein